VHGLADSGSSTRSEQAASTNGPPTRRPIYAASKRAFDLLLAGLGLLVISPVLILAAIAIKLDSTGPVFFLQERIGRNFRPFSIYKFRTMVVGADRRGGQITVGSDPRVTRVGRWLRHSKIDELPQLINVLLGDMSLVGPRPEVPKYVEMYHDEYALVLSVRPGLTDPASVKYRDEASILAASPDPEREYVDRILPDKIALARAYVARATLSSDLIVLVRTLLRIAR
jgi:lipopolysaccharide/colanic/teichoic acid biosynthesis glycosyltransferase